MLSGRTFPLQKLRFCTEFGDQKVKVNENLKILWRTYEQYERVYTAKHFKPRKKRKNLQRRVDEFYEQGNPKVF